MPQETRSWLDGFVAGINHHLSQVSELPHEFAVLGIGREPWTAADVLTLGRLAGADVTWLVWFRLLEQGGGGDRRKLRDRLSGIGRFRRDRAVNADRQSRAVLCHLLGSASRAGSNAFAVGPARTAGGAPLLAGDPHLSLMLPNLWMIAGYKSPSHHAVGLMVPGLPFVALGRNPWIAWGGASLHAASSGLCDMSHVPRDEVRERHETIRVRWGAARRIMLRETSFGPIVSDVPLLRQPKGTSIALRWVGHCPSDEITAMLRVSQARDWRQFCAALDGFAVPGLKMLYADRDGHVGETHAAHLPLRRTDAVIESFQSTGSGAEWANMVVGSALPRNFDPPLGYVAAANECRKGSDILIGFYFPPDDRFRRMSALIEEEPRMTVDSVMRIQQDVQHQPAVELRDHFCRLLDAHAIVRQNPKVERLLATLLAWDGRYEADSSGALAFELTVCALTKRVLDAQELALYAAQWDERIRIARRLMSLPGADLAPALAHALDDVAGRFNRFGTWGDVHRLRLRHFLGVMPLIGPRYTAGDVSSGGSNETLMKT
ncbi:MAG TPA: penicillin acylase family protein, partial [Candidatus Cybelea sp.]|nr:penicillin acylase family protein [Candidatus Cybelea sp.]